MNLNIDSDALDVIRPVAIVKNALNKSTTGMAVVIILNRSKSINKFLFYLTVIFLSIAFIIVVKTILFGFGGPLWVIGGFFSAWVGLGGAWYFARKVAKEIPNSDRFQEYDKSLGQYRLLTRYLIFRSEMDDHDMDLNEYDFACGALNLNLGIEKSKGITIGVVGAAIVTAITSIFANIVTDKDNGYPQAEIISALITLFFMYLLLRFFVSGISYTSEERNFLMCLYREELVRRVARQEENQAADSVKEVHVSDHADLTENSNKTALHGASTS